MSAPLQVRVTRRNVAWWMGAWWIPLVVFQLGCGNLTAGGFGESEVYASGDADEAPSSSPTASYSESSQGPAERASGPFLAGSGLVEGTLDATIDLALIDEDGGVHQLNVLGPVIAQMDLQGGQTPLLVERRPVSTGRYTTLRLRFTEVTANVTGGLLIEDIWYIGPVSVTIGATPFEAQAPISFDLDEGELVSLLLDLNSDEWLLTLNVLTQAVAAADFGASIGVTIR